MPNEPLPAIPIEYAHHADQTLLRMVRVLAILGLIIGCVNVASLPMVLLGLKQA